jgi:hypothetical protein
MTKILCAVKKGYRLLHINWSGNNCFYKIIKISVLWREYTKIRQKLNRVTGIADRIAGENPRLLTNQLKSSLFVTMLLQKTEGYMMKYSYRHQPSLASLLSTWNKEMRNEKKAVTRMRWEISQAWVHPPLNRAIFLRPRTTS